MRFAFYVSNGRADQFLKQHFSLILQIGNIPNYADDINLILT